MLIGNEDFLEHGIFILKSYVFPFPEPQILTTLLGYMASARTYPDSPRPFARRVIGPLLVVLAMFYLSFHAVSGERGLFALFAESRKLEVLKAELAEVKAKREALEHKVHLLSDSSLDRDLLDEQARRVLGKAGKGEVVYFRGENLK